MTTGQAARTSGQTRQRASWRCGGGGRCSIWVSLRGHDPAAGQPDGTNALGYLSARGPHRRAPLPADQVTPVDRAEAAGATVEEPNRPMARSRHRAGRDASVDARTSSATAGGRVAVKTPVKVAASDTLTGAPDHLTGAPDHRP